MTLSILARVICLLRAEVEGALWPLYFLIDEDDSMSDLTRQTEFEAAAFRRLLSHLDERKDAQNIDLMILAGFCRNCLADWYREAAEEGGQSLSKDDARELIYGEPFGEWKAKHQAPATPEQMAAFEIAHKAHK